MARGMREKLWGLEHCLGFGDKLLGLEHGRSCGGKVLGPWTWAVYLIHGLFSSFMDL